MQVPSRPDDTPIDNQRPTGQPLNTMPTTYETLRADIIGAVKARDSGKATILRTADAAIQRAAMDLSKPIEEPLVIATLRKAVKNLTDAKA